MFVGYKGVALCPSGLEQAGGHKVTPGGRERAYPVFSQERFGVILFFCCSSFYNCALLNLPFLGISQLGRYQNAFHAGGWVPCVVRFTTFYGFYSNLVWLAVNSDLVLWQTFECQIVVRYGSKGIQYNLAVQGNLVIWYKCKV